MGKRKSSKKPQAKKKSEPLATIFTCLFCNHERSVTVKLDKKAGVGTLDCKTCGQKFQCGVNYLSAPIDVFSEWVDAADAVAADEAEPSLGPLSQGLPKATGPRAAPRRRADEDEEARYEGEGIVADDDFD